MKKTVVSFLSLLAIAGIVTSCQKEERAGDGTQFTATMEHCTSNHGKTVLDSDANLHWIDGDQIKVYGSNNTYGIYSATPNTDNPTAATFTNVEGNAGAAAFHAIYPASVAANATSVALPAVQESADGSLTGFPMYATSSSTDLQFQNLCGILKFTLTKSNVSISSISVTTTDPTNGNFTVTYDTENKPVLTSTSTASQYITTLICTTPQDITNGADFYMYLPQGNYYGMKIVFTTSTGLTCTKTVPANKHIDITRSALSTLTLSGTNLDFVPEGVLSGLFTINSDGTKVRFAKGNLQYQPSTDTWRFADHQYDYVAQCSQSVTDAPNYTGWLDMFLWGTGNDMTATTGAINYTNYIEWGSYPVSNGGNTGGLWRTLTFDEWNYIFNNPRGNGSFLNGFSLGTVNGIPGLIILSDSFVFPSGLTFNGYSSTSTTWASNVYNSEQWNAMEEAGALFLPAASYYKGTSLITTITVGRYWSSQRYSGSIKEHLYFYISISGNTDVSFGTIEWRRKYTTTQNFSCSVRLACVQQ